MSYKMSYSAEEKIKLAKDDSVEKLYESKKNQRTMRVLTVLAYMYELEKLILNWFNSLVFYNRLTVSLAALILSFYYVFLWRPSDASAKLVRQCNFKLVCLLPWVFCFFFKGYLAKHPIPTQNAVNFNAYHNITHSQLTFNLFNFRKNHHPWKYCNSIGQPLSSVGWHLYQTAPEIASRGSTVSNQAINQDEPRWVQ